MSSSPVGSSSRSTPDVAGGRGSPVDRAFWVALSRLWPQWKSVLVIVRPETVVGWHQRRFRACWRSISTPRPQQRWTTSLSNHRDLIAGMDFLLVPTVGFQLLYVWKQGLGRS